MKKLLLILTLAAPSAWAQMPLLQPNQVLGNFGTQPGPATAVNAILLGTSTNPGTSSGILCWTSTSNLSTSNALAANSLVLGGGTGYCPNSATANSTILSTAGVITVNASGIVQTPGFLSEALGGCGFATNPGGTNTYNTVCGVGYASALTTGTGNTGLGYLALLDVTSGASNTAIGLHAAQLLTIGNNNLAIGASAMIGSATETGSNNTAIGNSALYNLSTGQDNTALGSSALNSLTTGNFNVGIGYLCGTSLTTQANTWQICTNSTGTPVISGSGGATPATSSTSIPGSLTVAAALTGKSYAVASTGRAYNIGTTADTLAASIATTYESANTATTAFTVTIAAPTGDGERRRICFANATGTITWTVTTPATATIGLPTTMAAGQCTEIIYNAAAGTPTNAPATTWIPY